MSDHLGVVLCAGQRDRIVSMKATVAAKSSLPVERLNVDLSAHLLESSERGVVKTTTRCQGVEPDI